jgi:hypothetical protein
MAVIRDTPDRQSKRLGRGRETRSVLRVDVAAEKTAWLSFTLTYISIHTHEQWCGTVLYIAMQFRLLTLVLLARDLFAPADLVRLSRSPRRCTQSASTGQIPVKAVARRPRRPSEEHLLSVVLSPLACVLGDRDRSGGSVLQEMSYRLAGEGGEEHARTGDNTTLDLYNSHEPTPNPGTVTGAVRGWMMNRLGARVFGRRPVWSSKSIQFTGDGIKESDALLLVSPRPVDKKELQQWCVVASLSTRLASRGDLPSPARS